MHRTQPDGTVTCQIQGDQARRKGTLSGGWLDPNRSKLTASKGLKVC